MQRKPLFVRCPSCPETRPSALVPWQGHWLCANCRTDAEGRVTRRGRCFVCWRDSLPLQRHHPGRALWHPTWHQPVCRSCHLVLSAVQKDPSRWDEREPFHDLLDQFDANHAVRELAQGTWEDAVAWAQSRSIFAPGWVWQDGDDLVLIPLGPAFQLGARFVLAEVKR